MYIDMEISDSDICMLADDLAGACDTGIEFLDILGQVTVIVDSDAPGKKPASQEALNVWNTESRDLTATEAYEKVKRASRAAFTEDKRILFKKTDSAFRGNFGYEIAAVMDELHIKICCIAPAIPDFGRVTRNGVQYLDGKPISESFYSKDPRHPVTESNVLKVAAKGNSRPVGLLTLETLRGEENNGTLKGLLDSGVEVIVVDGEFQEDLNRTVDIFLKQAGPLMFVGGQALGQAVARHCSKRSEKKNWSRIPKEPIMVVCGTLHPRSQEQMSVLSEASGIDPVWIEAYTENSSGNIKGIVDRALVNLFNQFENFGIGLLASPADVKLDPNFVENALAITVEKIFEHTSLSGLILTGGTTAYKVCRRIGIASIELRERIASGTILAQVPSLSGMAVCNKGGSLGEPDALVKVADRIKALI